MAKLILPGGLDASNPRMRQYNEEDFDKLKMMLAAVLHRDGIGVDAGDFAYLAMAAFSMALPRAVSVRFETSVEKSKEVAADALVRFYEIYPSGRPTKNEQGRER